MEPIYIIFTFLSIIIIVLCVIAYKVFKPENEKQFIIGFSDEPQQTQEIQNIELFNNSKKCKYFGCNNDALGFGLIPEACNTCVQGIIISSNT